MGGGGGGGGGGRDRARFRILGTLKENARQDSEYWGH